LPAVIPTRSALENTRLKVKPPDDVTGITFFSKSAMRPFGSARAVRSIAMRLALLALRRPTTPSPAGCPIPQRCAPA
jgi:hypothetical protein